jgi:4'-phosphopantetheinyl transferase
VLAAQELADLTSMSEADRLERFLQYWTLKEAYIKATGVGFALPLKQIAFDLRDPGRISVQAGPVVGDRPDEWQFRTWRTARHEVSVALRTGRRDDAVAVDVERVPAPRSASSHPGGSALLR